jgi:hypothetical protein
MDGEVHENMQNHTDEGKNPLDREKDEAINRILCNDSRTSAKERLDERRKKRSAGKTSAHGTGFFSREPMEHAPVPAKAPKSTTTEPESTTAEGRPLRKFTSEFIFGDRAAKHPEPAIPPPSDEEAPPRDPLFTLRVGEDEKAMFDVSKKNEEFQELLDQEFERLRKRESAVEEARSRIDEDLLSAPEPAPEILVTGENAKSLVGDRIEDYLKKADHDMLREIRSRVDTELEKPDESEKPGESEKQDENEKPESFAAFPADGRDYGHAFIHGPKPPSDFKTEAHVFEGQLSGTAAGAPAAAQETNLEFPGAAEELKRPAPEAEDSYKTCEASFFEDIPETGEETEPETPAPSVPGIRAVRVPEPVGGFEFDGKDYGHAFQHGPAPVSDLKTEAAAFAEQEQSEETDAAAFATEKNLEFGDSDSVQPADSYAAFEQYDVKETFEDGERFAIPTFVLTEEEPAAAAAESEPEPADAAAPAQSTFVFGPKIFGEKSEAPENAEPESIEESEAPGTSDAAEEEPAEEYAPERPPFILEPEVAEEAESPEDIESEAVAEELETTEEAPEIAEPEAVEESETAEDVVAESEIEAEEVSEDIAPEADAEIEPEAEVAEETPEDIEPEAAEEEPADIAPEVTEYEPERSIFDALPETPEEEPETTEETPEDIEPEAIEETPEIIEPEAESEIDAEAEAAEEVPEWAPVEEEQGAFTDELGTEYEPEEKPDWLRELEQLTQAFPLKGADPLRPAAAPPESLEYETGESETAEFATAGFEIEEAEAVPETPEEEAAETEEESALEGFTFDSPLSHSTPPTR